MKQFYCLFILLLGYIVTIGQNQRPSSEFVKNLGTSGWMDFGKKIVVDNEGNSYVTGIFSGEVDFDPSNKVYNLVSSGEDDLFLAKYDQAGQLVWAFNIGGDLYGSAAPYDSYGWGTDLAVNAQGMIYLIAKCTSGISDLDPSSNINLMPDYRFIVKFDGTKLPSSPSFFQWTSSLSGMEIRHIKLGINDDIFLTGILNATADMDPSSNTNFLTSAGLRDGFLVKYDGSKSPSDLSFFKWAFRIGGIKDDIVNDVAIDASGMIYITGSFMGTAIDFDPSSNINPLSSTSGQTAVFVVKYDGSKIPTDLNFYKWAFTFADRYGSSYNGG